MASTTMGAVHPAVRAAPAGSESPFHFSSSVLLALLEEKKDHILYSTEPIPKGKSIEEEEEEKEEKSWEMLKNVIIDVDRPPRPPRPKAPFPPLAPMPHPPHYAPKAPDTPPRQPHP